MDNLEQLSDDELRRRLLQFGFPNLPVTSTTRKVLIKKLRNYMDTERTKLRRETVHATRYSSDEDLSDSATAPAAARRSGPTRLGRSAAARATIAASVPPTSIPEPTVRPAFQRPAAAKYQQPQPPRMHLELSRPTIVATINSNAGTAATPNSSGRPPSRSPTVYVSPMLQGSSGDDDTDEDTADFGPPINSTAAGHNNSGQNGQSGTGGGESPYVSEFTQRLLNLRGLTVAKDMPTRPRSTTAVAPASISPTFIRQTPYVPPARRYNSNNNNSSINHSDTSLGSSLSDGGAGGFAHQNNSMMRSYAFGRNPLTAATDLLRNKLTDLLPAGKHSSMVPCILHSMLLAFFVLVAIAYLAINPNLANTIQAADTKYTSCTVDHHSAGVPCIESAALEPALDMIRRTAVELQQRAVDRRCRDVNVLPQMSAKQVIRVALESSGGFSTVQSIRAALHDMQYLVHSNPQWGIEQCDFAGVVTPRSTEPSQSPDSYFIIPNPTLSMRCKFYNKLQTFYTLVGVVALTAAIAYASVGLYGYVQRVRQARKDAVDFLIADIIQALMEKAATSHDPDSALIVINHLRDQLIAPAHRISSAWAWTEAIRFLEANESRIQFEVGTHNGEDCQMMRWSADQSTRAGTPRSRASLATSSAASSAAAAAGDSRSAVKKWQSPAFDKLNKIRDPPTPCLKIRHMFEPHEPVTAALQLGIQDAILEKVHNTGCRVFDVQLDPATCCVYVRCANAADAGIVHEQINGWWFDSRLVSIKFLHLERYVSRFPMALGGPKCLQPSNAKMLSMSACSGGGEKAAEANGGDEY